MAKVFAHGMVGGLSSVIQGGRFYQGFASAGVSQFASVAGLYGDVPSSPTIGTYMRNAVSAAVVGGTTSALLGGKFANGAITAAMGRLFNDLGEAPPRKTFYDGFSPDFLAFFEAEFPLEYGLFKEYALSIDASLWGSESRHYELAWRNFDSVARSGALRIFSMRASEFQSSVLGPQNMLSSIPGRVGLQFRIYNEIGTTFSAADLPGVANDAMTIIYEGPQVINESMWMEMFTKPYDSRLDHIVK
jgi:hypothetical protein